MAKLGNVGETCARYKTIVFLETCFLVLPVANKILCSKVEEIVENGEIPEENVHLPGVYVKGILKGSNYQKRIEVSKITPTCQDLFVVWS